MTITLEYGDALERANIEWIRETIPLYEKIWMRFIGHDGTGKPCKLSVASPISDNDRERFYQAHYTMLYALVILREINYEYKHSSGAVVSLDDFLKVNKDWHTFSAHLGKLRDMFKKMATAISASNEIWIKFSDFYAQRNSVLHGSNMPFCVDDGFVSIPVPAVKTAIASRWTDEGTWSNWKSFEYMFISDFMEETWNALLPMVNGALSCFLEKLNEVHQEGLPILTVPSIGDEYDAYSVIQTGSSTFRSLSGVRDQ